MVDPKQHELVGERMTPKMFYENRFSRLDDLDFEAKIGVNNDDLLAGSLLDLPVDNLAGFSGPNGFFCYAQQKLSEDGQWLQIASLAGAVKLAVAELNILKPIGILCIQGPDWRLRESRVSVFGQTWAPMTENGTGAMQPKYDNGELIPISRTIVTRGSHGVSYEYWVVLPCAPTSIKKIGGKAYMECGGAVYVLGDPQQVAAVLNGTATWILPDSAGNFIFPEFC